MKAIGLKLRDPALLPALAAELRRMRYTVAVWTQTQACPVRIEFDRPGGGTLLFPDERGVETLLPYLQEDFLLADHVLEGVPNLSPAGQADALTAAVYRPGEPWSGLADRVAADTPDLLPFPSGNPCCRACQSGSCRALLEDILSGTGRPEDCGLRTGSVSVEVNGRPLALVGFVRDIVRETNLGVLRLLDGYAPHSEITIRLERE